MPIEGTCRVGLRQSAPVGRVLRNPSPHARGLFDLEPGLEEGLVDGEQGERLPVQGVARVGDGDYFCGGNRL